jgi:hypothetical protein
VESPLLRNEIAFEDTIPLSAKKEMFSRAWYVKYELACSSAIRCRTGSVPAFGPASRDLNQAYRGKRPKRRSVVRARETICAKAAIAGTAPSATKVVVLGFVICVLSRPSSLRAKEEISGDLVCR